MHDSAWRKMPSIKPDHANQSHTIAELYRDMKRMSVWDCEAREMFKTMYKICSDVYFLIG